MYTITQPRVHVCCVNCRHTLYTQYSTHTRNSAIPNSNSHLRKLNNSQTLARPRTLHLDFAYEARAYASVVHSYAHIYLVRVFHCSPHRPLLSLRLCLIAQCRAVLCRTFFVVRFIVSLASLNALGEWHRSRAYHMYGLRLCVFVRPFRFSFARARARNSGFADNEVNKKASHTSRFGCTESDNRDYYLWSRRLPHQ